MPVASQGCETPSAFRVAAFDSPSLQQTLVPAQLVYSPACQSPGFLLWEASRGEDRIFASPSRTQNTLSRLASPGVLNSDLILALQ